METKQHATIEISDESLYNFPHIPFSSLGEYPDGLKDIENRRIDDLLIRGVLKHEEADAIVHNFLNLRFAEFYAVANSLKFPTSSIP